jgi:hypothetical protein
MRGFVGVALLGAWGLAWAGEPHVVRGGFEPGDGYRELTFTFEVSPELPTAPTVRLLQDPPETPIPLDVTSEDKGRYTVVLKELPAPAAEGRLLIELHDGERIEPHHADFVVRPHDPTRVGSHPSLDGTVVVDVPQKDAPPDLTLVLGAVDLPLDGLPDGIAEQDVLATWSLDLSTLPKTFDGWVLMVGAPDDAEPRLFWRPTGGVAWKETDRLPLYEHAVVTAPVPGPGTWIAVRSEGGAR